MNWFPLQALHFVSTASVGLQGKACLSVMMFNGLFHYKTNKKLLSHNNLDRFLLEQLGVNNRVINLEIYAAMSSILVLYE